eukprot:454863-Pyramimonas_sp.AAC.1
MCLEDEKALILLRTAFRGIYDLRTAFRCQGILTETDLRTWLVQNGLVKHNAAVGCGIDADAQEQILEMAIQECPTVRRLETGFGMAIT